MPTQDLLLTVITPAFNEAQNLPVLYQKLSVCMASRGILWEWVIVDDHSRDNTFSVVQQLAKKYPRVRGVRFARNAGSHLAILCGLRLSRGHCAVAMAADMQDPPAVLLQLLDRWKKGAQVVWAVRRERKGEHVLKLLLANTFYFFLRNLIGLKSFPAKGADFFILDRRVIQALGRFREQNINLITLICWMGFRQESISYVKEARLYGDTGWTLKKKLKLFMDTVTSFSYLPIRLLSYIGGLLLLIALCMSLLSYSGTALIVSLLLALFGVQFIGLGVIGEYVWRAFDESRQRPAYLIEGATHHKDIIV